MKNHFEKLAQGVIIVLLCSTLAACGGSDSEPTTTPPQTGGTGETTSTPPPMTVTVNQPELTVSELHTANASLTIKDADSDVSVVWEYSGGGNLSHVLTNDTAIMTYNAPEVEREIFESFKVTISDSDDSITELFSIHIQNTSATDALATIEKLITINQASSYFDELIAIAQAATKIKRFGSTAPKEQSNIIMLAFESEVNLALLHTNTVGLTPELLQGILDDYDNGLANEFELEGAIDIAETRINMVAQSLISQLAKITNEVDSIPSVSSYNFNVSSAKHSGYVNNSELGSVVNGSWEFNHEHRLFQNILLSPCVSL